MKTVVVVGASASIGGAIVDRFRGDGARVIATYHSDPQPSERASSSFALDLRSDASINAFADQLEHLAPRLDVAVFVAGLLPGKNLADYGFDEIDQVMAVNFSGQAKLLQRMLPRFAAGSVILMFSSISAQRGSYDPIYAAAKGAVLSLVKSLAAKLPENVRINAVAPSLIENSGMYHDMDAALQDDHRNRVPAKQLLKAPDLAGIIFDLSQDRWAHLNGACLDLNGGQYVR